MADPAAAETTTSDNTVGNNETTTPATANADGSDESAQKQKFSPFFFVQMADCQIGERNSHCFNRFIAPVHARHLKCVFFCARFHFCTTTIGMKSMDTEWADEVEQARRCIATINRMRPRPAFATMCGDLINKFPDPLGKPVPERERQVLSFVDRACFHLPLITSD